jgi:hypothetical protein
MSLLTIISRSYEIYTVLHEAEGLCGEYIKEVKAVMKKAYFHINNLHQMLETSLHALNNQNEINALYETIIICPADVRKLGTTYGHLVNLILFWNFRKD